MQEEGDDSNLAGMARSSGGKSWEYAANREITKHHLNNSRIERQTAWTDHVLTNKTSGGIGKPSDYFSATDAHKELRTKHDSVLKGDARRYGRAVAETRDTAQLKSEAKSKRVSKYAGHLGRARSLSHGSIEQARHEGFKKALTTGLEAGKATKTLLKDRTQKLTDDYRGVSEGLTKSVAGVKDKGRIASLAVGALKRTDMDLDRQYTMVRAATLGYMAKNGKPSKSLTGAMSGLKAVKKATRKTVEDAFYTGHLKSTPQ